MAYSGAVQVIVLHNATVAQSIVALDIGQDLSASAADLFGMIVPVPLMIYAFGMYVTESIAASDVALLTLQHSTVLTGTDTSIAILDFDSTNLASGDGDSPLKTASTGSEDLDAGDVVYAPSSSFPYLVPAAQVLTTSFAASGGANEGVPFIIARWQGQDLRLTSTWGNGS